MSNLHVIQEFIHFQYNDYLKGKRKGVCAICTAIYGKKKSSEQYIEQIEIYIFRNSRLAQFDPFHPGTHMN